MAHPRLPAVLTLLTCLWNAAPMAAQDGDPEPSPSVAGLAEFSEWLTAYKKGAFRLMADGSTDRAALAEVDRLLGGLARWNNLESARRLFEVVTLELEPPGAQSSTEAVDFMRELQPWKVKSMARAHLAAMDGDGIASWLVGMTQSGNLREDDHPDRIRAAEAMRILGESKSIEGKLALLEASRTMPPALRVKAVSALAQGSDPATVPQLLPLLKDREPNVRIATANALGRAMGAASDETVHDSISEEVAAQRDEVIAGLQKLFKDKVWQVRSAAAYALVNLKCKNAIPALIDGLDRELKRKKDPWAMDLRIHRLLEGMTGQKMLPGSAKPWKEFWKAEGATMKFAPAGERAEDQEADRYDKFFNLQVDSDRVLFVVDFSGSMKEPITLEAKVTGATPGQPIIKAHLIVQELKKMVLSLPDGAMFNIIVFSDDVKVWREESDGRPALVKLNDDTRDDLLGSFLDQLHPNGPTNLYGALEKALDFAGRGLHDKYYETGFDTLYILSDGAPTWGDIVDKDEIRRRVREANGLRKLSIHAVTFGELNDVEFLRHLAEENNGRHIHVK